MNEIRRLGELGRKVEQVDKPDPGEADDAGGAGYAVTYRRLELVTDLRIAHRSAFRLWGACCGLGECSRGAVRQAEPQLDKGPRTASVARDTPAVTLPREGSRWRLKRRVRRRSH